jgi:hypothetical protein
MTDQISPNQQKLGTPENKPLSESQISGQQTQQGKFGTDLKTSTIGETKEFRESIKEGKDIRESRDIRETMAESRGPSITSISQIQTIDKKIVVEKINETHFETQYVQKTVPVATAVQNEVTIVTAIQETKRVPITRLVEVVEQVPIKVVEEVIEYKTIPVTKFEEVIEQVPVKKWVPRTEYKKVPVTKLVEKTENVSVKRVEEKVEYQTITILNPINPVPLDSFTEAHSGVIQGSTIHSSLHKTVNK